MTGYVYEGLRCMLTDKADIRVGSRTPGSSLHSRAYFRCGVCVVRVNVVSCREVGPRRARGVVVRTNSLIFLRSVFDCRSDMGMTLT